MQSVCRPSAQPGFFDKAREDVQILLSDVPLTDHQRDDVFDRIHLARDGNAHIVEVVIDASGGPISGAIYAKAFDGMVSLSGIHRFEPRRFDRQAVEGRLHTRDRDAFVGVSFEYDALFSATIPRPPTIEEAAAVLTSPPGLAAAAYLKALLGGAWPAFLETLTADLAGEYRGPVGFGRFSELRAEMPANSAITEVIRSSATSAMATVQGRINDLVIEYQLKLALEGGAWKVGR